MDKKTPNKRKSLANTNTTPPKIQKTIGTPISHKKNKSPKSANKSQITPQKKQLNGKQNTPKEKKKSKQTEDDETELMNESDETDDSIEEAENKKSSDNSDSDEENGDESDETNEDKKVKNVEETENQKFSVYFTGLDYKLQESDIRNVFNKTKILSVFLLRKISTNKSKGSGFVNFKDEASVKKALKKNGSKVEGRILTVKMPMDRNTRKTLLLQKLKLKVQQLEEELSATGSKNIIVNPTNDVDKKNNIKVNKKKNANKKAVKKE